MILVGLKARPHQAYRLFPTPFPLRRYAQVFPTIELFWWHHLPDLRTIQRLRSQVPSAFRFSAYGHKHLTFQTSGQERRSLRRLLRRFRAFGEQKGALRLEVPLLEEEIFVPWLGLLEEVWQEEGRPQIALLVPQGLKELVLERGFSVVNGGGPFHYLLDPGELPPGEGFAYFTGLEEALGALQTGGAGLDS